MNDDKRRKLLSAGTDSHLQQTIALPDEHKERRGGFRENAGQKQRNEAKRLIAPALPLVRALLVAGKNLREIAEKLNEHGYRTRTDKPYTKTHVYRICQRESLR